MGHTRLPICLAAGCLMVATAAAQLIRIPQSPHTPEALIGTSLSRADAVSDLDALMKMIETVHPNLYTVRSREATDSERQKLVAAMPESMTRVEWWVRLSPFVAGFGDGHTNIWYPGEELQRDTGALLFPAALALDPEHSLIVTLSWAAPGELRRGDRLLEINGHDADALVRSWMNLFSGESSEIRAVMVADVFRDLLQIHGIHAPFTAKVSGVDGVERSVELAGITRDGIAQRFHPKQGAGAQEKQGTNYHDFSYRTLDPEIGYVNLRTFSSDLPQFQKDTAALFRQVSADHDRKLIIDLRHNGGGDSRLADELLRYITTTPYRMNARKDWKMSAEYRTYLKSMLAAPIRWLPVEYLSSQGRQLFEGPAGRIVSHEEPMTKPKRAEPFFSGKVCILIGPRTFSTASDLADAVKTYHLATLIGEETGGRPNTFGDVYPFLLHRSGFVVQVSSAYFLRASGDATDHRGVLPDIPVKLSRDDLRTNKDAVLERARSEN